MNLLQAQALVTIVNAELVGVKGSAYQNPHISEGATVLDGLTPFTFPRGLRDRDLTVVLDYNGREIRRYEERG